MKNGNESSRPPDCPETNGEKGEGKKADGGVGIALGMCFGSAFGLLIQIITGEIMWLSMGVAAGLVIGAAIDSAGKRKK